MVQLLPAITRRITSDQVALAKTAPQVRTEPCAMAASGDSWARLADRRRGLKGCFAHVCRPPPPKKKKKHHRLLPRAPPRLPQEENHRFRWSIRHVIFAVTVLPVLVCIIVLTVVGIFSGAWVRQETISAVMTSLTEQLSEELGNIFQTAGIENSRTLSIMVIANLSLTDVRRAAHLLVGSAPARC